MPKTINYDIKMRDGTTRRVNGLVINQRWGIDKRITQETKITKNGEERALSSSDFFLTHIPTGVLITSGHTQKILKELVNRPDMIDEDELPKIAKAVGKFWNSRGWQG